MAFFAYCTNYLIDLKIAVIVDVEATTAVRQAEVTAQRRMIDRAQERFGLWPERLAADTSYGSAENLAWLVHERGIEPHIPVFANPSAPTAPSHAMILSMITNATAASAQPANSSGSGMMRYRASKLDCEACSLKPNCCPNAPARKIPRFHP